MIKDHFLIRWMSADPWCRRCCELVQEVAMLIRLYLQFGPWISSINDAVWYNSSSKLLQTWIDDLLSAIAMLVFELCRIGTNTSFAQLFSFRPLLQLPHRCRLQVQHIRLLRKLPGCLNHYYLHTNLRLFERLVPDCVSNESLERKWSEPVGGESFWVDVCRKPA